MIITWQWGSEVTLERTTILIDAEKKKRLKELAKQKLSIPNNNLSDLIRLLIDEYLEKIDNQQEK